MSLTAVFVLTIAIASVSYFLVNGNDSGAFALLIGWSYYLYQQRHTLFRGTKTTNSPDRPDTKPTIESMYQTCLNRDRAQNFDDWVGIAIETMAVDEIESGNTNQELADELRERWGTNWEVMYPKARVEQELSKEESYWTALKKFDDKAAKDLRDPRSN
jgi:hypothetical protein